MTEVPFKSPTGFVKYVENTLGWQPDFSKAPERESWKAYQAEASKVKRKIATNPALYTWHNLALTVEWLRRRKKVISTPTAVLWKVEDALRDSATPVRPQQIVDIAAAIKDAVEHEQERHAPGWQGWVSRLTRAQGTGRNDTYNEWKQARQ